MTLSNPNTADEDSAANLRAAVRSVQVNGGFTEAVVQLSDGSRLCFCHRVGERWAKAFGAPSEEHEAALAEVFLAAMAMFRLNAKHLDIEFSDGSRWEKSFRV
jgi:hypothetical protein